jgi:hypothetical protein
MFVIGCIKATMKTNKQPQPEEPQEQATKKGVSSALSQEQVIAIADFLDVFIEIDLEIKQSKQG